MGEGVQHPLRVPRPVRTLGQAPGQQPIGALVDAALPRVIRIRKEHPGCEALPESFALGPLFALIIGQRFPE